MINLPKLKKQAQGCLSAGVSEGTYYPVVMDAEDVLLLIAALEEAELGLLEAAEWRDKDDTNGFAGSLAAETLAKVEEILKGVKT